MQNDTGPIEFDPAHINVDNLFHFHPLSRLAEQLELVCQFECYRLMCRAPTKFRQMHIRAKNSLSMSNGYREFAEPIASNSPNAPRNHPAGFRSHKTVA